MGNTHNYRTSLINLASHALRYVISVVKSETCLHFPIPSSALGRSWTAGGSGVHEDRKKAAADGRVAGRYLVLRPSELCWRVAFRILFVQPGAAFGNREHILIYEFVTDLPAYHKTILYILESGTLCSAAELIGSNSCQLRRHNGLREGSIDGEFRAYSRSWQRRYEYRITGFYSRYICYILQ